MKTVQDLVKNLNLNYDLVCDYIVTEDNRIIVSCLSFSLIDFSRKGWEILDGFCMLHPEIQKYIMDFVYSTTPKDWFTEKKYNIIIAQEHDEIDEYLTAYKKYPEHFSTDDEAQRNELNHSEYLFTESEVERLKSTLPENMAKIVDLGKVEVKDDED